MCSSANIGSGMFFSGLYDIVGLGAYFVSRGILEPVEIVTTIQILLF